MLGVRARARYQSPTVPAGVTAHTSQAPGCSQAYGGEVPQPAASGHSPGPPHIISLTSGSLAHLRAWKWAPEEAWAPDAKQKKISHGKPRFPGQGTSPPLGPAGC